MVESEGHELMGQRPLQEDEPAQSQEPPLPADHTARPQNRRDLASQCLSTGEVGDEAQTSELDPESKHYVPEESRRRAEKPPQGGARTVGGM